MAARTAGERERSGERGAALMTALLAAVFLSVLGLVLIEILKSGLIQAASTEAAIQAEALAQRGIDDAAALVRDAVEAVDGSPSPSHAYAQKVRDIEEKLDRLRDHFAGGLTVKGLSGSYRIEIVNDIDNYDDFIANHTVIPDYPYSRILTVRSTAEVGRRTAVKQSDIHVTTIHPVFHYPLSAAKDVVLGGAPFVVGDVLARDGKIYVFNKAYFVGSPGSRHAWETDWPTIKGFYSALAVERRDVQGNEPVEPEGIRFSHFEPFRDEQMPSAPDIPVAEAVAARIAGMERDLADPLLFQTIDEDVFGGHIIAADVAVGRKYAGQWVTISGTEIAVGDGSGETHLAVEDGVLTMEPGAEVTLRKGSLYVRYEDDHIAAVTFAGSLDVAPPYAVVVKGNAVIADGFHFRGSMFVDGSVQIIGSVNLEGALYVSGSVDMKDMRSINMPGEGGAANESAPLILLAGGPMMFSESRSDDPIRIRAYLYSRQPLRLYGVTSKWRITGGVHGEEVVLNALREDPGYLSAYWIDPDLGEPFRFTPTDRQLQLPPDHSNLHIFHDPALFTDPPAGIPVRNRLTMFVRSA